MMAFDEAYRSRIPLLLAVCLLAGCSSRASSSGAGPAATMDPITASARDAEPEEQPYFEPSRAFLESVARRDYVAAYAELSSHAKAKVLPQQFYPQEMAAGPGVPSPPANQPLLNVTVEQFVEWMGKTETVLGVPRQLDHVYVQSVDPAELSSSARGSLEHMFSVGAMPDEIPDNIRKASLRAQIRCQFRPEDAQQIAEELNISAEDVQAGRIPENEMYDPDEMFPYMNVKFVLVEELGQLKVGYFEFMPPSMLD